MLTALALTAALYCPVSVTKDFVFPAIYRAILRPDPTCTGQTRVRKVSTINPRSAAQKPGGTGGLWAWNLATVPDAELWTLYTWQWQWYDGTKWNRAVIR